jgi:hypothetical protein
MSPRDAALRTLDFADELGLIWGGDGRASLSLHGLSHDAVHALGGRPLGYTDAQGGIVTTRLLSPLGWEVAFFGDSDPDCQACRRLLVHTMAAVEAFALAELGSDAAGTAHGEGV